LKPREKSGSLAISEIHRSLLASLGHPALMISDYLNPFLITFNHI